MLSDNDGLVMALVRAHVMTDPEYMSFVRPAIRVRWSANSDRAVSEVVGAHYRRRANCKRTIDSLACVCKQPELMTPAPDEPPVGRGRRR